MTAESAAADRRSPLLFVVLVFALSIPLWLLGARFRVELLPALHLSPTTALVLFLLFFVSAIGEESGLFPNDGSHYHPRITGLIVSAVAVLVVLCRGTRTLTGKETT